MSIWIKKENDINTKAMAETLKISPMMAQILANRGINSKNNAIKFLNPKRQFLNSIENMKDAQNASSIILDGIAWGAKFVIYGDYDVDGVCSTAILVKTIRSLGGNVDFYIPDRESEGYGLNSSAVSKLSLNFDILIAVDNGISAFDEVMLGVQLGLKIIIIDHHETFSENDQELLPNATAIINPKQTQCPYPFKMMCAAGLSYRFSEYLHIQAKKEFELNNELIVLAALATYCDVVDLIGENRIIAKEGLNLLRDGQVENLGLNSLILARNITYGNINAQAIGFIIGPCINAAGRLENAKIAVELFLASNNADAVSLSNKLIELNEKRKKLCDEWVESAVELVQKSEMPQVLVLYLPEAHESIAGIIAGRLKEKFFKPAFVFTNSGDFAKGSARSIPNYNLFQEMQNVKDLFIKFVGHPMAAGALMPIKNIEILKKELNNNCKLLDNDFMPKIEYEDELEIDEVIFEFAQSLDILEPFGKSNKEPVFITQNILAKDIIIMGPKRNALRMYFQASFGRKIYAVSFNSVQMLLEMMEGVYNPTVIENFAKGSQKYIDAKLSIAYNIFINEYNGNQSLQLKIVDFKLV